MDTLITLKYIHRLHQNKIHKLTLTLIIRKKRRLWADLTPKRQIEYLKDRFRKFSSTIIITYTWSINIKISGKSGIIAIDFRG